MDSRKIDKALEKLEALHYIEKYEDGYKFTAAGQAYTIKKSGDSWIRIMCCGSLWVRCNPKYKNSWGFFDIDRLTEEQFNDFCEYYNIKTEKSKQLVICDEVEFMDI